MHTGHSLCACSERADTHRHREADAAWWINMQIHCIMSHWHRKEEGERRKRQKSSRVARWERLLSPLTYTLNVWSRWNQCVTLFVALKSLAQVKLSIGHTVRQRKAGKLPLPIANGWFTAWIRTEREYTIHRDGGKEHWHRAEWTKHVNWNRKEASVERSIFTVSQYARIVSSGGDKNREWALIVEEETSKSRSARYFC